MMILFKHTQNIELVINFVFSIIYKKPPCNLDKHLKLTTDTSIMQSKKKDSKLKCAKQTTILFRIYKTGIRERKK